MSHRQANGSTLNPNPKSPSVTLTSQRHSEGTPDPREQPPRPGARQQHTNKRGKPANRRTTLPTRVRPLRYRHRAPSTHVKNSKVDVRAEQCKGLSTTCREIGGSCVCELSAPPCPHAQARKGKINCTPKPYKLKIRHENLTLVAHFTCALK